MFRLRSGSGSRLVPLGCLIVISGSPSCIWINYLHTVLCGYIHQHKWHIETIQGVSLFDVHVARVLFFCLICFKHFDPFELSGITQHI